jgi:hypothetical protein
MYEVMRYSDEDDPDWGEEEQVFAAASRSRPKWVVSRSLQSARPNATLVGDDLQGAIRELKAMGAARSTLAAPGWFTASANST